MSYPQFQAASDYLGAIADEDYVKALPSNSYEERGGAVLDEPEAGYKVTYTQADAEQKEATLDDGNTLKIVYMVSRTNVVCNQALAPLDLSSFNMITLNNQMVYQMAPGYLIVMGVANLIYNMVAYLISALFFALFGYLMNRALKLNLKFGQIYLIAMYAKSVEILLESVLQVIGFSILYYVGSIIGIFITCSYMTRGMSSMLVRASDGRKGE